jgi:hypothetical protein
MENTDNSLMEIDDDNNINTDDTIEIDNLDLNTNVNTENNNEKMDVVVDREEDYFLWISHGETITTEYYRFETVTRIPKLLFYTTHGRFLMADVANLNSYLQCDPKLAYNNLLRNIPPFEIANDYYLGVREQIVGEIINDHYYSICLPPLLYGVDEYNKEQPKLIGVMGLYHFRVNNSNKEMRLIEKVMNWSDIDKELSINPNKRTYLTYSKIEGYIKSYINKFNLRYRLMNKEKQLLSELPINIDFCSLGIFTCRSFSEKYSKEGSSLETSPIDVYKFKNLVDFTRPEKFNQIQMNDSGCLNLLSFKFDKNKMQEQISKWEGPLVKIEYQGCAFNILNFYNLMNDELSRSLAVCLPSTGTSIFSFVDYLNSIMIKEHKLIFKYLVLRLTIPKLWDFFIQCKLDETLIPYTFIPVKLYKEDITLDNKKSLVGHFLSFWYNSDENKLYLIDPQQQYYITDTDIDKYINTYGFKYADIIIASASNTYPIDCNNKLLELIKKLLNTGDISVNLRPDELLWGGDINILPQKKQLITQLEQDQEKDITTITKDNIDKKIIQPEIQEQKEQEISSLEKDISNQVVQLTKLLLENEQIKEISFEEFSEKVPEDELFKYIKINNNSIPSGGKSKKNIRNTKKIRQRKNNKKKYSNKKIQKNRFKKTFKINNHINKMNNYTKSNSKNRKSILK